MSKTSKRYREGEWPIINDIVVPAPEPHNENLVRLRDSAEAATSLWEQALQTEIDRVAAIIRGRDFVSEKEDTAKQVWLVETPSGRDLWRGVSRDVAKKYVHTYPGRDGALCISRMFASTDQIPTVTL